MFEAFRPAARAVAVAALMSGLALPAFAQTSPAQTSPAQNSPAQATTPAPAASSPAPAMPDATAPAASSNDATGAASSPAAAAHEAKHSAAVEKHIAGLKKALKITKDQEQTWNSFADVMRQNGEAIEAAVQEREDTKGMDAIHDLQSYAKVAQVHADGAQKLAAAFQPVYDALTPAQKKNADTLFEHTRAGGKMDHAQKKS